MDSVRLMWCHVDGVWLWWWVWCHVNQVVAIAVVTMHCGDGVGDNEMCGDK